MNKAKAKEIWAHNNVPTAPFQVFYSAKEKLNPELNFPLIVKPVSEGSSKGIKNNSVVNDEKALKEKINEILKELEEFGAIEEMPVEEIQL